MPKCEHGLTKCLVCASPKYGKYGTQRESVVLKAGTIVAVGGFPFRLLSDSAVDGQASNLTLGLPEHVVGVKEDGRG